MAKFVNQETGEVFDSVTTETGGIQLSPVRQDSGFGLNTEGVNKIQASTAPRMAAQAGMVGTNGVQAGQVAGAQGNAQGGGATIAQMPTVNSPSAGGGGGMDTVSAVFSAVDKVFSNVLSTINVIGNRSDAAKTAELNKKYLKLAEKAQQLSKLAQEFNQKLSLQNLGLSKQAMALNTATTAENLATSGTNRYQSEVTFNQLQQDRTKNQNFLGALASGIAKGLASSSKGKQMLGPAQAVPQSQAPMASPYAMTPSIAGVQ